MQKSNFLRVKSRKRPDQALQLTAGSAVLLMVRFGGFRFVGRVSVNPPLQLNFFRYPPQSMVIVKTERLVLRKFRLSDADAMNRVFGDPEVMYFGDGVQTPKWVHEWLHRCFENDRQKSGIGPLAVVEKSSTETIGYCGLFYFPDVCGQPETEIGYRLVRPYWGRGYATEAARAVRDYAFNILRLPRLIAMIDPQNVASIRVVEKLGMHYEKDVMFEGYTHPDRVYAIVHPEGG